MSEFLSFVVLSFFLSFLGELVFPPSVVVREEELLDPNVVVLEFEVELKVVVLLTFEPLLQALCNSETVRNRIKKLRMTFVIKSRYF